MHRGKYVNYWCNFQRYLNVCTSFRDRTKLFVPTLADIRLVRGALQSIFPAELVEIILYSAEYLCISICDEIGSPTTGRGTGNSSSPGPISIQSGEVVCVTIPPLTEDEVRSIVRLSVMIKGHDQGWTDYCEDHGSTRGSWTWYTITFDKDTPPDAPERLATNLHASLRTQTHAFEWDRESEVVRRIRAGQAIKLWAHAR